MPNATSKSPIKIKLFKFKKKIQTCTEYLVPQDQFHINIHKSNLYINTLKQQSIKRETQIG